MPPSDKQYFSSPCYRYGGENSICSHKESGPQGVSPGTSHWSPPESSGVTLTCFSFLYKLLPMSMQARALRRPEYSIFQLAGLLSIKLSPLITASLQWLALEHQWPLHSSNDWNLPCYLKEKRCSHVSRPVDHFEYGPYEMPEIYPRWLHAKQVP